MELSAYWPDALPEAAQSLQQASIKENTGSFQMSPPGQKATLSGAQISGYPWNNLVSTPLQKKKVSFPTTHTHTPTFLHIIAAGSLQKLDVFGEDHLGLLGGPPPLLLPFCLPALHVLLKLRPLLQLLGAAFLGVLEPFLGAHPGDRWHLSQQLQVVCHAWPTAGAHLRFAVQSIWK